MDNHELKHVALWRHDTEPYLRMNERVRSALDEWLTISTEFEAFRKGVTRLEKVLQVVFIVGRAFGIRLALTQYEKEEDAWLKRLRECRLRSEALEVAEKKMGPCPQVNDPKYLERAYGPLAPRSAHDIGSQATFLDDEGKERTGTIIWVHEDELLSDGPIYTIEAPRDREREA